MKHILIITLLIGLIGFPVRGEIWGHPVSGNTHLDWAQFLVREVQPDRNSYRHENQFIRWYETNDISNPECHTDCSGFITALLQHTYGLSPGDVVRWFGKRRPLASDYFMSISGLRGFKLIRSIADIRAGDFIAIKYPADCDNSGHIMLVAKPPRQRGSLGPNPGCGQWETTVIDFSQTGHGSRDTRYRGNGRFQPGVGQGDILLFADSKGRITGYSWSSLPNSQFFSQNERPLVVGRLGVKIKRINIPRTPNSPDRTTALPKQRGSDQP